MVKSPFNSILFFIVLLTSSGTCISQLTDTTQTLFRKLNASLSSSYTANANWQGQDFQHYSFAGSLNIRHQRMGKHWNHQHLILCDLSYIKFIDSLWIKNTDRMQLNFLWSEDGIRFRHSYSINFNSQFLPTYHYQYNFETKQTFREKTSWIFCPAILDMGYGIVRQFWQTCNINVAFATVKISAIPKNDMYYIPGDEQLARGNKAYYKMEYGLMFSTNIQRKLNDRVSWTNASRFFCNAINREQVNLDVQNRITIQLWKFLQLRFETRLAYNPLINYHFQFSQEVMLGAGFELSK